MQLLDVASEIFSDCAMIFVCVALVILAGASF